MTIKITIQGHPATKKNSQQIITKGRRPFLIQSKMYREYEKEALRQIWLLQLSGLWGDVEFTEPVLMRALYYVKDNRKRDLLNLLAATADILEKSGIIKDDSLIVSVDGSRIMGKDPNPRTEIELTCPPN